MNIVSRLLVCSVVVVGCGNNAQNAAPAHAAPAPSPAPAPAPTETPIVGGYSNGDVAGADAREQAGHAIALLQQKDPSIKLTAITSFAMQVVAGRNFRFELEVSTAAGPRHVSVVMFQGLDQHRELSSVNGL